MLRQGPNKTKDRPAVRLVSLGVCLRLLLASTHVLHRVKGVSFLQDRTCGYRCVEPDFERMEQVKAPSHKQLRSTSRRSGLFNWGFAHVRCQRQVKGICSKMTGFHFVFLGPRLPKAEKVLGRKS